jgi:nicotinate phosphoribosyltransferase
MTVQMTKADVEARTDAYFLKTQQIVQSKGDCRATYAVFMRTDVVVAVQRAIDFIKASYPADCGIPLEIKRMAQEGSVVPSGKPILYIIGSMAELAPMETLFLQRIGFSCVAAFNAYQSCAALPKSAFIAMDARHCAGDEMHLMGEYGASVGSETAQRLGAVGFIGTSTSLAAPLFGKDSGIGTMPHALVGYAEALRLHEGQARGRFNSTLEAAKLYAETFPEEKTITVLVDFSGQEVTDAIEVCRWFSDERMAAKSASRPWNKELAFRLDTHGGRHLEGLDWNASVRALLKWTHKDTPSEVRRLATSGIDLDEMEGMTPEDVNDKYLFGTGVTAAAVIRFREALDSNGFHNAKIVASSGFDAMKCRIFGNLNIPVDVVGTGSFLPSRLSRTYATADIVRYEFPLPGGDWKAYDLVKVGREHLKLTAQR